MLIHLQNEQDFQKIIESKKVLVDFFATWCGPCRMLIPVLEELGETTQDFDILKIDVDQFNRLAATFNIRSVPTLIKFENGKAVAQTVGYHDADSLIAFMK